MLYDSDEAPEMRYAQALRAEVNRADADPEHPHELLRLPSFEGYLGECPCGTWKPEPQPTFSELLTSLAEHYKTVGYTPPPRPTVIAGGPTGELEWVLTEDVKEGMRIQFALSNAVAYPVVTGWKDKVLQLSRFEGLKDVTHRVFELRDAPWWVDDAMRRHGLDNGDKALVVREPATGRQ